ncbi:hypothetical protein MMC20_002266 [Loxospora ochrophaea]|nr:hypothetical protein [Loxospora ochrophaea]
MDAVDFVPGTVHLVDLEGVLRVKHASGQQEDIVLIPAPSEDPDDPLNWSAKRKLLSTTCICVYTLMVGIASAAIYSVLEPIATDTGLTLSDLNAGTGYMFLFFGWGCLFWQPLALQYGKRPVYLLTILATMAIMVWVPYTNTNGQWIASKILQGFFGAPIESLCEISMTDVYFTHERGSKIALYAFFLAGSNFLAPILAGFINEGQGWKWVLYWCAIFCAIGFVFLFFFLEETNYRRDYTLGDATKDSSSSDSKPEVSPFDVRGNGTGTSAPITPDVEHGCQGNRSKKSYWAKLQVFETKTLHYPNRLQGMVLRPLIFLGFPVISFAGFSYGSSLVWFNVLNGTTSLILSEKPYGFSSSILGLFYISPLIGVTLASLYTGRFGDWVVLKIARRNSGIMEPEHRLWLFSLSLLLVPGGFILWGVGAAHAIHWVGLAFGMGFIGFINTVGLQLSISYCIDSYRELSGEAIITVIIIRNTMSFAIGYGITPWVTNMGLQNAFIVAAFAGLAQIMTIFVFIKYGYSLRKASVDRYRRYVKEMAAAGLVH